MYGEISALRAQVALAKQIESSLAQKLQILQDFNQSAFISDKVLVAIPQDNSSLAVLSQIKKKAQENGVALGQVNVGKGVAVEGAGSYADITFEAVGELATMVVFMQSLSKTAPLGNVESVEIGGLGAEIIYRIHWAPLPTQLPSLTDPLAEFSDEEKILIAKLTALESAAALTLSPQPPALRKNPFGI